MTAQQTGGKPSARQHLETAAESVLKLLLYLAEPDLADHKKWFELCGTALSHIKCADDRLKEGSG